MVIHWPASGLYPCVTTTTPFLMGLASAAALMLPTSALAGSMYELDTGLAYDLENPPSPAAGMSDDLHYHWVPLCEDGSGDHEWSNSAGASGTAPTCVPDDYIRCIDGTRPLYYVDRARLYNGTADTLSNSWVFWFQGGGSCSDADGVGAGENCWNTYLDPTETDEMGTSARKTSLAASAILDPDRSESVFKTYNRVRIMKCSYDRFMGTSELLATPNGAGDDIDLFWHGRRMIEAVVADLEHGITFTDEGGQNTLPPLTDAFRVLFAGHSGGSGGLIMNGDWLASLIHAMRPAAKVRLLVDARWKPGIENEASYDPNLTIPADDANGDGQLDLWDHIAPTPASPGELPGGGDYHRATLQPGGRFAVQQDQWGAPLDASCEAALGNGATRCRDEIHVLANHVETPYFLRQALRDRSHVGGPVSYADDPAFRFTDAEFRDRVVHQLNRFVDDHDTLSMAASGAAGIPAPTWAYGVFAPNVTKHVGNSDDQQFFDEKLCEDGVGTSPADAFSYHDALFDWITYDTQIVAVEDAASTSGEYCDPNDVTCSCY